MFHFSGLLPGDELIEVNGQNVATVDPSTLDMILKTDSLTLVVRSMRPSTAPCLQCSAAAAGGHGHGHGHGVAMHHPAAAMRVPHSGKFDDFVLNILCVIAF